MFELKQRIITDMKSAMKAKDTDALKAIRMVLSAIKQKEVDERIEVSDEQALIIIQKMIKQRKDSIMQFTKAGRSDLVDIEASELAIINNYMPAQLSKNEISIIVEQAILNSNASSMQDMGRLMALLKKQLAGKADISAVSKLVKSKLS